MDQQQFEKFTIWSSFIGPLVFLILSSIAMLTYPGGNGVDPDAGGYSFAYNFFSDLGMQVSYSGQSNAVSSIIFGIGLITVGVSLIPYFLYMPRYFSPSKNSKIWLTVGSALGIAASLAYIGIAFTPWDVLLPYHMAFVYLAFPLSLPMVICYILGIRKVPYHLKFQMGVFIAYIIILAAYLALLFFGPQTNTRNGRFIQVIGQKIVVYSTTLTMALEGVSLAKSTPQNEEKNDKKSISA